MKNKHSYLGMRVSARVFNHPKLTRLAIERIVTEELEALNEIKKGKQTMKKARWEKRLDTVRVWIRQKKLPATKKYGRRWLISMLDVPSYKRINN